MNLFSADSFDLVSPDTPPTTSSTKSLFSYSKLTQLQVNGARDRSQRLVEKAEYERRLQSAQEKWHHAVESIRRQKAKQAVAGIAAAAGDNKNEDDKEQQRKEEHEMKMYQDAVKEALEADETLQSVSTFIIARLAVVLRKEYQVRRLDRFVDRLHEEQKTMVSWVCRGMQEGEEGKRKLQVEGKRCIATARLDLEKNSLDYTTQCQAVLRQRREAILKKLQQMQEPSLILESDAVDPLGQDPDVTPAPSFDKQEEATLCSSSEWLEEIIDESHFPPSVAEDANRQSDNADAASDWVICGF